MWPSLRCISVWHQYWIRITFLKFTKNAPKAKVFRRAAPFGVTHLAGRYFCMSITVPDFRFSPRYDFHTSITNPPWHISALGSGPWWEGRRKRFYPNTISRLNLEFPVLNKMKVFNKGAGGMGGWSGWVKYAPLPPADRPPDVDCGSIVVAFWPADCDTIND